VAAVETLLALRALPELDADVELVAPNPQFVYQPLAVAAPFDLAETHPLAVADIAADHGARLHVDSLAAVDTDSRCARLRGGSVLAYDALVVAVGARRRPWLSGASHFGDAGGVAGFRELLARLDRGAVTRLAFVSPADSSWTLPLYELALLTASRVAESGIAGLELTVLTAEPEPLAVFGPAAGRMLHELLADRGIVLRTGVRAERFEHGALHLEGHPKIDADEVVALAQTDGPDVPGLPCDAHGFIEVDEYSRVGGRSDVYAAGDGTTFPVKQGGIATQQADAAAEGVAAALGADLVPTPLRPTLRGKLLTGISPAYLYAQLEGPAGPVFHAAAEPLWWPPSKIAGNYLAQYLLNRRPLDRDQTLRAGPLGASERG